MFVKATLYFLALAISYVYGYSGNILDIPTTLPSAEVCITGDTSYEWHYASPLGPLTSSLHVGFGINKQSFYRGIISPVTPLFNQLEISITSALPKQDTQTEGKTQSQISSPMRTVNIYPKKRNGDAEYNAVLEELIENEMKTWDYSRNSTDHDATYFFLPASSMGSPTLYTYQYMFEGTGVMRYFTFILSQQTGEERFPALWPWIIAKLRPEEEVTISTHLLITQDAFTLSHTPSASSGSNRASDLFGNIVRDHNFIENFPYHQMAFISDIKYGEQLLLSLNVTSRSPAAHPYFSTHLLHAVKDLMTETLPIAEFEEKYPKVSFNVSFQWNPITLRTRSGQEHHQVSFLSEQTATELLDTLESWRDSVLLRDPAEFYPVAVQARSLRIVKKNQTEASIGTNSSIDEEKIRKGSRTKEELQNFFDETSENMMNHDMEQETITTLEAGNIVHIHVSRCALGNLPPQTVLEMFWELSFLTTITAFSLVTVVSYFCLGGILHQIVLQDQFRLPFFVHIHEVGVRLRFVYIWP